MSKRIKKLQLNEYSDSQIEYLLKWLREPQQWPHMFMHGDCLVVYRRNRQTGKLMAYQHNEYPHTCKNPFAGKKPDYLRPAQIKFAEKYGYIPWKKDTKRNNFDCSHPCHHAACSIHVIEESHSMNISRTKKCKSKLPKLYYSM